MKLWMKMLIGLALGVITGIILGPNAQYLKPVGTVFLGLLNMLVVLLVFSSMTIGITSINDTKKLGRVGLKTVALYAITTAIAIVIGLVFAYWMKPGEGIGLAQSAEINIGDSPEILTLILSMVPSNPVSSLANGNVLQIIVFALFLGIAITLAGEKGKPLLRVMESLAEVMYKVTGMVMNLAPYGVFAIMAWVAGTFGAGILLPLLKFVLANYIACAVHMLIVFCGILYFMAKVKPGPFFKGMGDAIAVAFSTSSSSATLPVSLHCVQQNLGIPKNIASFVLPLGSTINMNGTAIFQGITAVFIAQAYGIELGIQNLLIIVVTATLSAVGAAGIPGGGLVTLSIVLSSVGLPIEGIALVAGVDRLRDTVSTVVNILGDGVVAVYVSKKEGELDEKCYYSHEKISYENRVTD